MSSTPSTPKSANSSMVKSPLKSPGERDVVRFASITELLECPVCSEPIQKAKLLSCGHAICGEPCLEVALKNYKELKDHQVGQMPCPVCRRPVPLPDTKSITSLPEDFKVQRIRQLLQKITVEDSAAGKKCDLCSVSGKTKVPEYFCVTCSKQYCRECRKKHDAKGIFRSHEVVAIHRETAIMFCKQHSNENVKYYCQTCSTAVCTLCVLDKHSDHDTGELTEWIMYFRDNLGQMYQQARSHVQHRYNKIAQLQAEHHVREKAFADTDKAIQSQMNDTVRRAEEIIRKAKERGRVLQDQLRNGRQALEKAIGCDVTDASVMAENQSVIDHAGIVLGKQHPLQLMAVHDAIGHQLTHVIQHDHVPEPDGKVSAIRFMQCPDVMDPNLGSLQQCVINVTTKPLDSPGKNAK